MKKGWKVRFVGLCALLLVCAITLSRGCPDASDNPEQETIIGDGWTITGQRGTRTAEVDQCEGTDELIYITYSLENYIDVYDYGGAYLYTIMLPDARNGSMVIDCRDDLLIAKAKTNTVYLFRGTVLVEQMGFDEATERGLNLRWSDTESDFYLTQTHVVRSDGEELFELPPEISENLPKIMLTEGQQKVANVLFLIGFAVVWLTIVGSCVVSIWKGFREDRGKS